MSKRNKHWDAIIIGVSALVLAVAFPQSYYEKYIVNLSLDTPTVDAKGKGFYIILHFLAEHIGKLGLQIIFGVIALICFYVAYRLYTKSREWI